MRDYHVYILASRSGTLYIGVTNELRRRIFEHRAGAVPGFTTRYRVTRLVYVERTSDVRAAIAREKQLKRWPRWRKERLIEAENPGWADLAAGWFAPGMGRGEGEQIPTLAPPSAALLRDDNLPSAFGGAPAG